jgi:hypothetical protein
MESQVVEDSALRSHVVSLPARAAFAAFLDGAQESQVLAWAGAAPIVHGVTAAVVRERIDRRLVTWGAPLVQRRIYAPLAYAPGEALVEAFPAPALVDTASPGTDGELPPGHPSLLLERARLAVSRDRELLELRLAEEWCRTRRDPLMIDGGIGASEAVASAECVIGVVKSHRTLYVAGAGLDLILGLRRGERSSVLRIAPRGRAAVHSWYLRLRDAEGHDALWGLVRVEVSATSHDLRQRADEVSRWILAESTPLSIPDPRWDKMAYGVRSCEEYIRAVW